MNESIKSQVRLTDQLSNVKEPPKNKLDKLDQVVVNKEDDNSYEEPVTDNTNKQPDAGKQSVTEKKFEYKDDGEFQSDDPLIETDSSEEYL